MADVEWKKRSISTAAAVRSLWRPRQQLHKKKKQQQAKPTTQNNKVGTGLISNQSKIRGFAGVPLTRNHANRTKISTLKSRPNF